MFFKLLGLEWKSFFRSASLGKGLAVKLMLAFLSLYFFVCFLLLGIGLYFVLQEELGYNEPILVLNNYLLIWFFGEFIIRFLFQNIPLVDIKPLLAQGVSRSRVTSVISIKSLFSFFNIITLTVAVPFVVVNLNKSDFTFLELLGWLIAVLAIVIFLNFFNLWLQQRLVKGVKTLVPMIAALLVLIGLEYYNLYSISTLFGSFFTLVLSYPLLGLLPILLSYYLYKLASADFRNNLYLDTFPSKGDSNTNIPASDLSWLSKLGKLAPFIQLDIKLLMRNKRAKNTLYLSFFFLFYGILIYSNDYYGSSSFMNLFVGIFITGVFVINFGQFIPAWDSSYFSLLRTQPIQVKDYLASKVLLMYVSVILLTLLSLPYIYYGWDKVYLNFACAIYNLGVNIPVILLFSTINRKRIDLDHGSVFNYQGMGASQWLISIPLILMPMLIWGAMMFVFSVSTANIILIVLGCVGMLLTPLIVKAVASLYVERRYKMVEGFKQKD